MMPTFASSDASGILRSTLSSNTLRNMIYIAFAATPNRSHENRGRFLHQTADLNGEQARRQFTMSERLETGSILISYINLVALIPGICFRTISFR